MSAKNQGYENSQFFYIVYVTKIQCFKDIDKDKIRTTYFIEVTIKGLRKNDKTSKTYKFGRRCRAHRTQRMFFKTIFKAL